MGTTRKRGLTVAELIKRLGVLPLDAVVIHFDGEYYSEITSVTLYTRGEDDSKDVLRDLTEYGTSVKHAVSLDSD